MTRYDRICRTAYDATRGALLPDLLNSQYAYRTALAQTLARGQGSWLDLGCGHALLPLWMNPRTLPTTCWRVIGIDLDRSALARNQDLSYRLHGNIEQLPFRADVFDLVSANTVMEHIQKPQDLFAEVARVLKPGGRFVVHTPNVKGYTTMAARVLPDAWLARVARFLLDRKESDVYPTCYRANSFDALERFSRYQRFILEQIQYVSSSPHMMRIPPLMVAEVVLARILAVPRFEHLRACIVVVFRKPEVDVASAK